MSSISSQKDGSGFSFVDSLGGESGRRASGDLAGAMNHFTGYNQDFEGKDEGEERQHELPKLKIRNKKSRPLHRNQACITCRGRKVRCDATKPGCGACRRSAAAHGEDPDLVICEYDDEEELAAKAKVVPEAVDKAAKPKKASAKVAALEEKIAELERLIAEHNIHAPGEVERSPSVPMGMSANGTPEGSHDSRSAGSEHSAPAPASVILPNGALPGLKSEVVVQSVVPHDNSKTDPLLELFWPGWPSSLPHPNVVSHVTNIFLNRTFPGGFRGMIDPAAFRTSLTKPPASAAFPHLGLIHAMMAVAYKTWGGDELAVQLNGGKRYWLKEGEPVLATPWASGPQVAKSAYELRREQEKKERIREVADYHIAWALRAVEESLAKGAQMFQMSQAVNIICWYFYLTARFVEAWIYSGLATRIATPLGLNHLENCNDYEQGKKLRARSLMPAPTTTADKFHRAMTFWLAFQADRFATASSGWPSSLDERDISTLIPSRPGTTGATLEPVNHRTHPLSLNNPDFFSVHPPDVEEFQMELKATVLIGRVASWLRRAPGAAAGLLDPRTSDEFIKLDQNISAFRMSTPRRMLDTRRSDGSIDQSRVLIIGIPHAATIVLHEPFITRQPGDPAHERCMQAARAILSMTFSILGSSIDFRHLYCFTSFSWTAAGRALIRDYALKESRGDVAGLQQVRGELDVLVMALEMIGVYAKLGTAGARLLQSQFDDRRSLLPREDGHEVGNRMQGVTTSLAGPLSSGPSAAMDFAGPFDQNNAFAVADPSWASLLPRAPDGSIMTFDNFPTESQLQELDVNFLESLVPSSSTVLPPTTTTAFQTAATAA